MAGLDTFPRAGLVTTCVPVSRARVAGAVLHDIGVSPDTRYNMSQREMLPQCQSDGK